MINDVGKRIRELRKTMGLNQEQLGAMLGVTKSQISKLENGTSTVTIRMAKDICQKCNADYLWLTEGAKVPMFIEKPDSLIDSLCKKYSLTQNERSLLESYLKMPPQLRDKFIEILDFFYESNNT